MTVHGGDRHEPPCSHLQRYDVLCGVLLLVDDDAPVHQDVVKQEELSVK